MKETHLPEQAFRQISDRKPFTVLLASFIAAHLTLVAMTKGGCNDACGVNANTYTGLNALSTIVSQSGTGFGNTAMGAEALLSDAAGFHNTAIGDRTLFSNTTGNDNCAVGAWVLENNNGDGNVGMGDSALRFNVRGHASTAIGANALAYNNADHNVAVGWNALFYNLEGSLNTAVGTNALYLNSIGNANVALGSNSLYNNLGNDNTALGVDAGANLTKGNSNIEIANKGLGTDDHVIRIGTPGIQTNTYVAGISETFVSRGRPVFVDCDGHLGTPTSAARFVEDTHPIGKESEAILRLHPVTFHYKKEIDSTKSLHFGLVAEDTEQVSRDLVEHDSDGRPAAVRSDAINALLLSGFQKEHEELQQLKRMVEKQRKEIAALAAKQKARLHE